MDINLKRTNFSPLRYPGGKNALVQFAELIIVENNLQDGVYVEPYSGGASVALSLLINEFVSEIHINDYDYSVFAFWYSVMNHTNWFIDKLANIPLNITTWKEQKEIQNNRNSYKIEEVGFSTFYLNRTNRSGIIMHAGVIGGYNQSGKWLIDARFNKQNLIKKIVKISSYKTRVKVHNKDAIDLSSDLMKKLGKKTLFYFDPPYYHKAERLYRNTYSHADHVNIAKFLTKKKNKNWFLSYDNVQPIGTLYQDFRSLLYFLNYSAAKARKGSEAMFFSENLIVPQLYSPIDLKEIKEYIEGDTPSVESNNGNQSGNL